MTRNERMRIYMRNKRKGIPRKILSGTLCKNGAIATKVVFPPDMFEALKREAVRAKTSFSEQARLFIEWGFESVKGSL